MNASRSDAKLVAIVAVRPDGRRVLFKRSVDCAEADATIKGLARIGLHAEIVADVDPTALPGSAIPAKQKPRGATRGRRTAKDRSQCGVPPTIRHGSR